MSNSYGGTSILTFNRSSYASFLAGSVAGASGVLVGHPFDSLKVRLQVGQSLQIQKVNYYILRQLYRGIVPPLMTVGLIQSVNFSLYEYFKHKVPKWFHIDGEQYHHSKPVTLATIFTAGTLSGALVSTITTPISIIKIRMQVATEAGIISCIRDVYATRGIRSFYRGYGLSFIMESPGRGVYLGTYEYVKALITSMKHPMMVEHPHTNGLSVHHTIPIDLLTRITSAVAAGIVSWFVIYPFDVIKAQLQLDIGKIKYQNSLDCTRSIYQQYGWKGFFRGLGYTLVRAGPVAATILPMYDAIKDWLDHNFVI